MFRYEFRGVQVRVEHMLSIHRLNKGLTKTSSLVAVVVVEVVVVVAVAVVMVVVGLSFAMGPF